MNIDHCDGRVCYIFETIRIAGPCCKAFVQVVGMKRKETESSVPFKCNFSYGCLCFKSSCKQPYNLLIFTYFSA